MHQTYSQRRDMPLAQMRAALAPFRLEAPVQSGFLPGHGAVDSERIDAALTSLATLRRTF